MVALMKLPGYYVSPLLDLAPINEGLDSLAKRNQLDKQNERADKQMAMQEKQFSAQQQDRMRKLIAGRAQMIMDEPDDAKAAALFQRHFASPEIQAAIKENGLDPADFRGVAKAFHAEALGPVDPLERAKTQAQIDSAKASTAASYGAERRASALHGPQLTAAQAAAQEAQRKAEEARNPNLVYERRRQTLQAQGIDPNSPEGRQFTLTGDYKPDDPLFKYKYDEGVIDRRSGNVLRQPTQRPDSTARTAIFKAQDELPNVTGAIEAFDEMKSLVPKAYHGFGSSLRSRINEGLPGPDILTDNASAKATNRLGVLLSEQAITTMANTLKGATTNEEMMAFRDMLANPNISAENKLKVIDTMRQKAARHYQTMTDRIRELGGTVPDYVKPGGAADGGGWSIKRLD